MTRVTGNRAPRGERGAAPQRLRRPLPAGLLRRGTPDQQDKDHADVRAMARQAPLASGTPTATRTGASCSRWPTTSPALTDSQASTTKANIGQARQTSKRPCPSRRHATRRPSRTSKGGWKDKAEALGLTVPPSVQDPETPRALLVAVADHVRQPQYKVRNPRVQTVNTLAGVGRPQRSV